MTDKKPRLFTGIQPTGNLHVGNFLGAIKPTVKYQDKYDCFLCVVDLHAITKPYKPKDLPTNVRNVAIDYLAGGIDPKKSTLFIQSHVPAHSELMWLLNTVTSVGELQRMIQYKEFKERFGDPKGGILNYPILMAADILIYGTDVVPVGDDQTQHIELTRDIVKKFNNQFGKTLREPKHLTLGESLRIMSLNDPSKKMSKSLGTKNYIALSDSETNIRKKVMSAVTGVGGEQKDSVSPGVKNLFTLLELLAPKETVDHMKKHEEKGTLQYVELKAVLADHIIDFLKPIQERRVELENNLDFVAKVLTEGSEKAREVANKNLKEIKGKMGIF